MPRPPTSAVWNGASASTGDVLIEGDDILGEGVNIAARLEGIAEPGGICISEDAFRKVRGKVKAEFADLGEQSLKNIASPLRVYRVRPASASEPQAAPTASLPLPDKPSSRIRWLFVTARNSSFTYKGQGCGIMAQLPVTAEWLTASR